MHHRMAACVLLVTLFAGVARGEPTDPVTGDWRVEGRDAKGEYTGAAKITRLDDGRFSFELSLSTQGGVKWKRAFVGTRAGRVLEGRRGAPGAIAATIAGQKPGAIAARYDLSPDGTTLDGKFGAFTERLTRRLEPVARITILHTNDLHGQVRPLEGKGGLPALVARLRRERDAALAEGRSVITLDAGDLFAGTPEGDLSAGKLVADLMALAGYDAASVGNHEFDKGPVKLAELAQHARFPLLAANLLERATKQRPAWARASQRLTVAGIDLCVVGAVTNDLAEVTTAQTFAPFDVEKDELAIERELQANATARAFVLLTHVGKKDDERLAARFKGRVAAIVGGHSHTAIKNPVRVPEGEGVLVTQAGDKSRFVGRIDLELDRESGRVQSAAGRLFDVRPEEGEAQDVARALEEGGHEIQELMDRKVGELTTALRRKGHGSTGMGNLLTDIARQAGQADLAFLNKTGIRAELPAGDILMRHVYMVAPFDDPIVVKTFTGAEVREIVEHSLAPQALGEPPALEVSGLSARFDLKRPVGQRVLSITVAGAPLDPEKTYRIAGTGFLQGGGDGHETFTKGRDAVDTGLAYFELVRRHFDGKKIDPGKVEARLVDDGP